MHLPLQRSFTLRLDADDQHIAGRLEDERGRGEDFVGWLGLARVLESLMTPPAPEPVDPSPTDTGPE